MLNARTKPDLSCSAIAVSLFVCALICSVSPIQTFAGQPKKEKGATPLHKKFDRVVPDAPKNRVITTKGDVVQMWDANKETVIWQKKITKDFIKELLVNGKGEPLPAIREIFSIAISPKRDAVALGMTNKIFVLDFEL